MSYSRSVYSSSGSSYRPLGSSQSSIASPRFIPFSSAASVHAGAGGSRISVSRVSSVGSGFGGGYGGSSSFSGFGGGYGGSSSFSAVGSGVVHNEKETMQDLNDRLASYLEKVRSLETANQKLEVQIREHVEKKGPCARDWSPYFKTMEDLRKQIFDSTVENAQLVLQIDNARLAADDFRVKYEAEMAIRVSVEMDITGLRKVIDDTNLNRMNLENEIESLKEELIFLKKNHEDEVANLQAQIASCGLTVEVDAPKTHDLGKIMADIRAQYEALSQKNREDAEKWYQAKLEEHTVQVTQDTEALQSARTTVTDLSRTVQSLEIEMESLHNLKANLEATLRDTEARYAMEIDHINSIVLRLEADLAQIRNDSQHQAQDYETLFNIKMKLEEEISTYRRLLDGGDDFNLQDALIDRSSSTTTQMVKKVITTTQKVIDGKVVSESNDMQVIKS
ncbi:keratin, type I cytoskeletal 18 [Rhinatrema bivittatum]|uniref:keratin, type I cytoskeletal 18 n=1 Tax=Rhinatrema bivittatum TaxID=194408 RepID=UPI00112E617A|nr:keratin, type I cytoskeletal 18 [Rhinatrema bivittatum]